MKCREIIQNFIFDILKHRVGNKIVRIEVA